MTKKSARKVLFVALEIMGIIVALIFVYPALMVITNAVKPIGEILKNPFALPKAFTLKNILDIIENQNFFSALFNTLSIAVVVVVVTVILSAMAGYKLGRFGGKISIIISMLFISCMLVPFQAILIPIAKMAKTLTIAGTKLGYVLIIIPLYAPMGIFVCQGFVKTIPISLEESAVLDGCNPFETFFRIVFPLLTPILASITVLYSLWIWNDYALASLMLTSVSRRTLTLMVYSGFSKFSNRWDFSLATLSLSVIPVLIFYVFMQKYIVRGITAGAIKG
ncbi:MAG: carbohydrate ABC transporter permease [Spirochaetaceae bacterium]|jgi:raffinose/stachyose/melibiose transport system permease protein|nr:carbohydrate ABC transporter permease [Spirochaetaceae bacterium]